MSEKIEIVKKWIEKADHDLGTGQLTYLYLPQYRDTIAFHCQQAAEKYLKGFLLFSDIPFKKQHSLNYLLGLLSQKIEISDKLYDDASELEDFAVEIRYPDTSVDLSDEEIQQAFKISKQVREFVLSQMNLTIDYTDVKKE
ncbi:MAG: HEPN domain-containing protein [Salinivirgaceae bacterium]|nr:HEPN domain-containing protein [Salinivirgaceae bacterium]